MRIACALIWLLAVLVAMLSEARADLLQDHMADWRRKAFTCTANGKSFPSKAGQPSPNNPQGCDDGDMTLFNALLCAAGEKIGCDAVIAAQEVSGRWWRSPRRIGIEHTPTNGEDDSFSPDQALGVLLYVVSEKQETPFRSWSSWIDDNRPCWSPGTPCALKGWPRYCPDDLQDKRCTFRPVDCALLEAVGLASNLGAVCKVALKELGVNTNFEWPLEAMAFGSTIINDVGFPMHLAAVQILILQRLGLYKSSTDLAALVLTLREPRNPFFAFLAQGNTQGVRNLTLSLCPKIGEPPTKRSQWAWERSASETAWKDSMYWDCIFMGRLLGAS